MSNLLLPQHLATATGNCLPRFTGEVSEDINLWCRTFELYCSTNSLNENQSILLLFCSLGGKASCWIKFAKMEERPLADILAGLRDRFSPTANLSEALEKLSLLSKNSSESWVDFVERFGVLADQCKLSNEHQVAMVLRKLPVSFQVMFGTLGVATITITLPFIINALRASQHNGILAEEICNNTLSTACPIKNLICSYCGKKAINLLNVSSEKKQIKNLIPLI